MNDGVSGDEVEIGSRVANPDERIVKCIHCKAEMEPIHATQNSPAHSVDLDEEDPDYMEHCDYGIDITGEISVGLEICRNCHTLIGHWIESSSAPFHSDWGEDR